MVHEVRSTICPPTCVQVLFRRSYYHLGTFIYRNPACFLVVPICLTILGAIYADVSTDSTVDPTWNSFVFGGAVDRAHVKTIQYFGGHQPWPERVRPKPRHEDRLGFFVHEIVEEAESATTTTTERSTTAGSKVNDQEGLEGADNQLRYGPRIP